MNQWIHIIGVPAIYTTALVFLRKVPLTLPAAVPTGVTEALLKLQGGSALTAALPVAMAYAGYYLYLSPSLVGAAAGGLALAGLPASSKWITAFGAASTKAAVGTHIAAWVAQFWGHGYHEGRSPALLDNLFQGEAGRLLRCIHWPPG